MKKGNAVFLGLVLTIILSVQSCQPTGGELVSSVEDLHEALKTALPGDVIVMASGEWKDAELLVKAEGTKEKPIKLTVEEKGKVILTGLSNLRISGAFIEISGLVFKDGHTPTSEVISFREKKGVYANNCRLTECVIDSYNHPERFENEQWITLYGRNNRVDHCVLNDKRTKGVTLVVRLVDEACQNNQHRIDHNYFGYRQVMGSNGGETMRIGTSHYSLTSSGSIVEGNYFDRCQGEVEIISSKSCDNVFRNNTFFECKGTLTFRHGHDNLAEGNFFLGNGIENSGGIRIINERNRAINNYFYGLKGYRFRGAMVIMNGVPNSPINRYNQVIEGVFSNNSFVNCDHIQLCAGSDAERSLPPVDSKLENNVFYYDGPRDLFTVYDDISGIEFQNNYASPGISPLAGAGIRQVEMKLVENPAGILIPTADGINEAGCSLDSPLATKKNTGVSWYRVEEAELSFDHGDEVIIMPGLNTIYDALAGSKAGDIFVLKEGEYVSTKDLLIEHPLTVKAAGETRPTLLTEKAVMFTIANEGALKIEGLKLSGKRSPDQAGNSMISTSKYSMNRNYKLFVKDCSIEDLEVNHSFNFLTVYKHTFADSVLFRNCSFKRVSGNIASFDREPEDLGIYNAEYVNYEHCTFEDIGGLILNLYRGGTDESTFGPILTFSHSTVKNAGKGKRNKSGGSMYLHGVQLSRIDASSFSNSAPLMLHLTNGEPKTIITDLNIYPKAGLESNSKDYVIKGLTHKKL